MMENKCRLLLMFFYGCLLFGACSEKSLDPSTYVENIEGQKCLQKTKIIGNWIIDVNYLPAQYMAVKETGVNVIDRERLRESINKKSDMEYYTIKVDVKNVPGFNALNYNTITQADIDKRAYYLSYQLQNDIWLEQSGKKYPARICHFERTYNLTSYITIDVALDKLPFANEERTLVFNAKIFGIGITKFYFSKSDFNSIPTLKV